MRRFFERNCLSFAKAHRGLYRFIVGAPQPHISRASYLTYRTGLGSHSVGRGVSHEELTKR